MKALILAFALQVGGSSELGSAGLFSTSTHLTSTTNPTAACVQPIAILNNRQPHNCEGIKRAEMASSIANPTIVLVQGSFQLPDVYHKLADALRASGHSVVQPLLPSLTDPDKPDFASKTLSDDAAAVRAEVKRLVEEGKTVVLVMHSYGGLVGTEAVTQDLSFAQRQSSGLPGGVGEHSQQPFPPLAPPSSHANTRAKCLATRKRKGDLFHDKFTCLNPPDRVMTGNC